MLAAPAHRVNFSCWLGAAILAAFSWAQVSRAQPGVLRIQGGQVQIGIGMFGPEPRKVELTPPRVDLIAGATASRLEQVRALLADKNWDEAVDILRELAADATDRVVAIDSDRYVRLRMYCQWKLSQLPAEALAAYRRRVDPLAERWYRAGMATRDEALLRRVVDELFCSSWGDDALSTLGELSLERGDYAAARRNWEQINPLTRDPNDKPLWISLRNIDLEKHWPEIERRWPIRSGPPTWLAYPDTSFELADVRARLVLVSIREGSLDRAAFELAAFRRWHPNATGRLGGQEGLFTAALERLLASAKEWRTLPPDRNWTAFAGAQSRSPEAATVGPLSKTAWAAPVSLTPPEVARPRVVLPGDQSPRPAVRESEAPLSCFPVVVDGLVLYADAMSVHALELATGLPAITPDGTLFRAEITPGDANAAAMRSQFVAAGVPRFTVTVIGGIAYARVGQMSTARVSAGRQPAYERLAGIDLRRDGLLTFQAKPDDERWSFEGSPVGDNQRIYIAMRHGDATPQAYVACFDVATGRRLWRTSIGAADTPAGGNGDEVTHNLLSLVGDRIFFNTNLGLVAALDAEDGSIEWIRRYKRKAEMPMGYGVAGPLHLDRDPSPCLVHEGLVIVAPSDTPALFALDADTGRLLWSNDKLADALHLLGVIDDRLVVTGNRFWSIDVGSGIIHHTWPESEHAGIRGLGRGVLAGNEVFWPTRKEIYVFDARTGARTRPPIDLSFVSDAGANLVAGNGYLVVAGRDRLIATGPQAPAHPTDKHEAPRVADAK